MANRNKNLVQQFAEPEDQPHQQPEEQPVRQPLSSQTPLQSPRRRGPSQTPVNQPSPGVVRRDPHRMDARPASGGTVTPGTPAGPVSQAPPAQTDIPAAPAPSETPAPTGDFDQSQVGEPLPETPAAEEDDQDDSRRPDRKDLEDRNEPEEPEGPESGAGEAGAPEAAGVEGGEAAAGAEGAEGAMAGGEAAAGAAEAGAAAAEGAEAAAAAAEAAAATAEAAAATAAAAEGATAAVATSEIWVPVLAVVGILLILGIIFMVVIMGIGGSAGGSTRTANQGTVGQGSVTATGDALRQAFTKQKNITYQNPLAEQEIAQGHVADHVLQAVLWVSQQPGIGNLAISAAWCGSHTSNHGTDFHCPSPVGQAQGSALDIGSTGTSHPDQINKLLCQSALDNKNPYHINELFGITPTCILDQGKKTSSNPDPPNHVHVATDGGV